MAPAFFYIPAMLLIFTAAAAISDLIEYFTR